MTPALNALLFLLTGVALANPTAALAALPDAPIPRVEARAHSDFIKKIDVAENGAYLLSVSDDKTARLWHAASGRLIRIFRVPIGTGYEGQLYAGALSPDGRYVVVGGFTGSLEASRAAVYVFSATSGQQIMRLTGLPSAAVDNLAFSPDGGTLAVCMADSRGILLFDWNERKLLRHDTDLVGKILGAHFAPNGDFAFTTYDGLVGVYRARERYAKRESMRLTAGQRPMHVRYSPDGLRLVVGLDDAPAFSILTAAPLAEQATVVLNPALHQRGLHAVEWSADGRYIYAAGQTESGLDAPIYRWSVVDLHAEPERVAVSTRRISDVRRLGASEIAFSSGEPELGVLSADKRMRWRVRGVAIDPRSKPAAFVVSNDASVVGFASGNALFRFSVAAAPDAALQMTKAEVGSSSQEASSAPVADAVDVRVAANDEEVYVAGMKIPFDHREQLKSRAWSTDRQMLLLGTTWALRAVSVAGTQLWRTPLTSAVEMLRISADGEMAVAAISDGTLRWFRRSDGAEVLALLVHRNGRDWIAWIPPGYYTSSSAGDSLMGWHVNRSFDQSPDFFSAVQFERLLYRPDVVHSYFAGAGRMSVAALSKEAKTFDISQLGAVAPPRIALSIRARDPGNPQRVTIALRAERQSPMPLREWNLYVNGIPVVPGAERTPSVRDDAELLTRSFELDLHARSNSIRAEVSNGLALGVAEEFIEADLKSALPRGKLYLVSVGVSEFSDPAIKPLRFAARDALVLAETLIATSGKRFTDVDTLVLADSAEKRATGGNIADIAGFLSQARGEDTVVVFLASHGLSDARGNYYFVPADGSIKDVEAIQRGVPPGRSLVNWQVFFDALRQSAGRRVLIVDTCSSSAIEGTFDAHSLAKRSVSSSFALLAASKGSEESQETASERHGLFTYGLLEALRTGFDPDGDGAVSLSEAFEYAFDRVQELRNKAVGPQTPQFVSPEVLRDLQLAPGHARTSARVIESPPVSLSLDAPS